MILMLEFESKETAGPSLSVASSGSVIPVISKTSKSVDKSCAILEGRIKGTSASYDLQIEAYFSLSVLTNVRLINLESWLILILW